jgi:hypothetical protein
MEAAIELNQIWKDRLAYRGEGFNFPGLTPEQEDRACELFEQVKGTDMAEAGRAYQAFIDRGVELGDIPLLTRVKVTGDWRNEAEYGPLEAYHTGDNWNGWLCPLLTEDQVRQLVKEQEELVAYNSFNDSLLIEEGEEDEYLTLIYRHCEDEDGSEQTRIDPEPHKTVDGELWLYDVAFAWTWEEAPDPENANV